MTKSLPQKVLAVFAHPDDEAFGPGGTLALWANQGATIHLLCATRGEAGRNASQKETARIRSKELKAAAKILGIKKIQFLGLTDGEINNNDLQYLEKVITKKIQSFKPDTIITFDLNGISGHLDHIAVSSAATHSFKKTKIAQKMYYLTITKEETDLIDPLNTFIHMPEGKTESEIHESIDISSVWDRKLAAMHEHKSQLEDIEFLLDLKSKIKDSKKEHFLVRKN